MAWDSKRPVPWKRLGIFLGLYAGLMIAITAATDSSNLDSAAVSVAFGVLVAASLLIVLVKFGWTMPMLRSREDIARVRAERIAARSAGKESDTVEAGPRPRPAPTSRTSAGHNRHRKKTGARKR